MGVRILLHVCCGPCAVAALAALSGDGREPVGFWHNPNIHPFREYQARLMSAGYLFRREARELLVGEPDFPGFLAGLVAAEKAGRRCAFCWAERLEASARKAAETGCDAFTTTLLASPHQDRAAIAALGREAAGRHGLTFLDPDLRVHWKEAAARARAIDLYRQNYCGCLYSEWSRRVTAREPAEKRPG